LSFVSNAFAIFATIFFALYFLSPSKARRWVMLGASYIFCTLFSPWFVTVLLGSTIANWVFVQAMTRNPSRSRTWMIVGIVTNIALLGTVKYLNFLRASYADALGLFGLSVTYEALTILVPIGVSFYTFQSIGLLIDVQRGRLKAPSLFEIALLLAFWPKLIAGPIVRGTRLIPQIQQPREFKWVNLWLGAESIVYGLALKTMLADYLAPEVNKVYNSIGSYSPVDCLAAVFLYTFQIYGDFAGYSLMAIGLARISGYHLPPNFRRPNFARSFGDFWTRWHISLSNFLSHYVYRSLPYNGPREVVRSRNTIVTMLISGLWHGPAWTFVSWGGMHGLLLVANRFVAKWTSPLMQGRLMNVLSWPAQVGAVIGLVALTRVFFRSKSMADAMHMLSRIAGGPMHIGDLQNKATIAICFLIITGVFLCEALVESGIWLRIKRLRAVRVLAVITTLLFALVLGEFEGGQFVYVRF
jgi:D-alanyl-lipoteichoic acid acyltransferase DltB (MBOAT superfamily)